MLCQNKLKEEEDKGRRKKDLITSRTIYTVPVLVVTTSASQPLLRRACPGVHAPAASIGRPQADVIVAVAIADGDVPPPLRELLAGPDGAAAAPGGRGRVAAVLADVGGGAGDGGARDGDLVVVVLLVGGHVSDISPAAPDIKDISYRRRENFPPRPVMTYIADIHTTRVVAGHALAPVSTDGILIVLLVAAQRADEVCGVVAVGVGEDAAVVHAVDDVAAGL